MWYTLKPKLPQLTRVTSTGFFAGGASPENIVGRLGANILAYSDNEERNNEFVRCRFGFYALPENVCIVNVCVYVK